LLENARKKHLSAEDRERAIINKARYEAQAQAARKARDARENLFEEKKRAFLDLLNSGKACMPFKSLDQLNRYKQDDACSVCPVIEQCNKCRQAVRMIGRPNAPGTYAKKATVTFKYAVKGNYPNVTVNVIDSPIGAKTYNVTDSNKSGFRKILTSEFCPQGITGNQISGLTKILNQKGFDLR